MLGVMHVAVKPVEKTRRLRLVDGSATRQDRETCVFKIALRQSLVGEEESVISISKNRSPQKTYPHNEIIDVRQNQHIPVK